MSRIRTSGITERSSNTYRFGLPPEPLRLVGLLDAGAALEIGGGADEVGDEVDGVAAGAEPALDSGVGEIALEEAEAAGPDAGQPTGNGNVERRGEVEDVLELSGNAEIGEELALRGEGVVLEVGSATGGIDCDRAGSGATTPDGGAHAFAGEGIDQAGGVADEGDVAVDEGRVGLPEREVVAANARKRGGIAADCPCVGGEAVAETRSQVLPGGDA
jgi:hypothetical protein